MLFRVARVHAEQLAGKQAGLVSPGAGADLEHHVALVVGILRPQLVLQPFLEGADALLQALALFVCECIELVVGREFVEQLLVLLELCTHLLQLFPEGHHRRDLGEGLARLTKLVRIGEQFRVGETEGELPVRAGEFFEAILHSVRGLLGRTPHDEAA